MIVLQPPLRSAPDVVVAPALAEAAGDAILRAILRCVRETGRCRLGLSGGTAPVGAFQWLRTHVPHELYGQLRVTWVDERHLPVPNDLQPGEWQRLHADSNARLAYEHWLGHVPLPHMQVLPMSVGADLRAEVVRFGRAFAHTFDGGLDVAVLGVGPDGHIASLFPGHPGLEVDDLCFAVHDSPKPPAERISLALPVLDRARFKLVIAAGEAKSGVVARGWRGDRSLPLGRLDPRGCEFLVDPAAATDLLATWSSP
jgi:6-phosphogluconolactonase